MKPINKLADFPRLEQLARALWRQQGGGPGAALMVGAGFSRNYKGITPLTQPPPLWHDLRARMAEKLSVAGGTSPTADPLRLAEEFRAYFGQSALDDFIRANVPDVEWVPGAAHKDVVELPWSDIMTTNWDTLLERAARTCRPYNYDCVLRGEDLAHTRSPRIIKLHGTIGDGDGYVFAEEDYRTYPTKRAALVNAARQVFIENEVCLLGFSGDDPNFLQWTGWVRDQLGAATRRIYLVGVLSLTRAARQLLEARNIAAIDLAELVDDVPDDSKHAAATSLFLTYLKEAQRAPSHDWEPTRLHGVRFDEVDQYDDDDDTAAYRFRSTLSALSEEREKYPGWLIAPFDTRRRLSAQVGVLRQDIQDANSLDVAIARNDVLDAYIELAWRYSTSLRDVPFVDQAALESAWEEMAGTSQEPLATRIIGPLLLRQARENEQGPAFRRWASRLEGSYADPDFSAIVAYERALLARDREDWEGVELAVNAVQGQDPAWILRRARLLFDLHRTADGVALLETALEAIRDQMATARDSVWLRSRRAWCQYLLYLGSAHDRSSEYRGIPKLLEQERLYHCNPQDELRDVQHALDKAQGKQLSTGAIPMFRPGTYQDARHAGFFERLGADRVLPYDRLRDVVGLPLMIGPMRTGSSKLAADVAQTIRPQLWFASFWPHTATQLAGAEIEREIGRIVIARFSKRKTYLLRARLLQTIDYWLKRARIAGTSERGIETPIRGALVLLSRLTPRLHQNEVADYWKFCVSLAADDMDWTHSFGSLVTSCIDVAVDSMSPDTRASLALEVMQMPYADGRRRASRTFDPASFSEILSSAPSVSVRDPDAFGWSQAVERAIVAVTDSASRPEAGVRLLNLMLAGSLTSAEATRANAVLWSQADKSTGLPADLDVAPALYLSVAAPDGIDVASCVERASFPADGLRLYDSDYLQSLVALSEQSTQLKLPPLAARRAFRQVVGAVETLDSKELPPWGPGTDHIAAICGRLLARVVMPRMGSFRPSDVDEIFTAIEHVGMRSLVEGLPLLSQSQRLRRWDDAVGLIQTNLLSSDWRSVVAAARAVEWWFPPSKAQARKRRPSYPSRLTATVLAAIDAHRDEGAQYLLSVSRKLLTAGILAQAEVKRLAAALVVLLNRHSYTNVDPLSSRAIGLSAVRRECRKLLEELPERVITESLKRSLHELRSDPLPEVREDWSKERSLQRLGRVRVRARSGTP
jgi:hypothetical protein